MKETSGEFRRPIRNAVLLAVGSELTTGETRDTNGGDLAMALSRAGVTVEWISALPDTLETVVAALARALEVADLVVTTGGLGPADVRVMGGDDVGRTILGLGGQDRPGQQDEDQYPGSVSLHGRLLRWVIQ